MWGKSHLSKRILIKQEILHISLLLMWDDLFLILIVLNFIFIVSIASSFELHRFPTVSLVWYYYFISVRECTWLDEPKLRLDRVQLLKADMAGICRVTWEKKINSLSFAIFLDPDIYF